ncbi:MAG: DNA polymerase I [Planctomycetota bacterium]
MTGPDTLYLIDGYAQFFRAYYAIRTPMTSPVTKEPTNLTFGFVGMLLKLLRGEGKVGGKPFAFAVALDVSGDRGTFRSELFEDYKANRDAPPEDLGPQVDRCLDILKAIGVPTLGKPAYEADDVIAGVVKRMQAEHPNVRVRIISKDKDLKQLLAQNVEMYDIHTDAVIDEAALMDDIGITPAQVVDMLALMGDTVDNVPGVEGIGPKTAAKLIAEHGSLDELMASADSIKGKRGEKLRAAADRLPLSKELVTLRDDADGGFDLDAAKTESFDLAPLGPILKELGFNRFQEELKDLLAEPEVPEPAKDQGTASAIGGLFEQVAREEAAAVRGTSNASYLCVKTEEELSRLVSTLQAADMFAVDTETSSVRPMLAELVGLSFATKEGSGWYVPVRSPNPKQHLGEATVLDALREVLGDASKPKIGHNLKFDLLVLRRAGVELRGFDGPGGGDTMVASYLLDASRSSHKMDSLALAMLGHTCTPITELIGSGKKQRSFAEVPLDQASHYAAEDADITLRLANKMLPQLERDGLAKLAGGLEMPLVGVLAELEWNGILVDPDELDKQRERLTQRIEELKTEIAEEAESQTGRTFDPDSPKQLGGVLFNKPDDQDAPGLGIKPLKKTKTGYSTDAEVLEKLAGDPSIESPIPSLILEYRQLTKLVSTYLVALKEEIHPETRRVHASFNQTVAATGRLSSSDPNLQNIPIRTELGREIRRAFVAAPGQVLISADYSQIELRLLAHLSQDPNLIEAFRSGADIHREVAAQIHGVPLSDVTSDQRSGAKMVNFGIVYGITAFGLARRLGVPNGEAQEIIDAYKRRFSGITTFLAECVEEAKSKGLVETIMGRRRPIGDIDSNNPARRSLAERMAINSVVQGSAADLIKLAMVDLHARLGGSTGKTEIPGVRMLLQIHDELVFEAPESRAEDARTLIVERMERAMSLDVPLVVDSAVSDSWFGGK